MNPGPAAVVLLGAQRFDPTLRDAVAEVGVSGRIATVTAGWQEREGEDDDLREHLGGRAVNLELHRRGEQVFADDPELRAAHQQTQRLLRHRQDLYRLRLEHGLEAEQAVRRADAPPALAEEEAAAALQAVRALDRGHLARCAREHAAFEARLRIFERPGIARQRRELRQLLEGCEALAIAGGHVATLVNRLALFGIGELCGARPVFAWSGGAMAISERVVLFHDAPPQGPGASEVLDAGLGLLPGVVPFPEPERRLRLERKERVASLARRFAPALCLALPARARLLWRGGRFTSAHGVVRLREDGDHQPFAPEAAA